MLHVYIVNDAINKKTLIISVVRAILRLNNIKIQKTNPIELMVVIRKINLKNFTELFFLIPSNKVELFLKITTS
tara:strand:- start:316 stop:537 length:222 start_codon:yes stop_codon:yes gene_type:complete